jgi:hypothetical protein
MDTSGATLSKNQYQNGGRDKWLSQAHEGITIFIHGWPYFCPTVVIPAVSQSESTLVRPHWRAMMRVYGVFTEHE